MTHCSDSALEIEEEQGNVQHILLVWSPATRAVKERKQKTVGKRIMRLRTGK
jgi:hypothetical protein